MGGINKFHIFVSALLVVCVLLVACSNEKAIENSKGPIIIRVATVQPDNHSITIALNKMKKYIESKSNNKYEVRIFGNGVMGGNSETLELLQFDTLDLVATSGSNLELYSDAYKIFGIPYLFKDERSFRKVMQNEDFVNKIYNSTLNANIKGVQWFANGVNNFYSPKKIENAEDLKGLKVRVQASEANVNMVRGFDAAAVVLAYGEVYTALQNKVIDVGTNPETALVQMKHGEVAKYYSKTEHQIFTDILIANTKFLDRIKEDEDLFKNAYKLVNEVQVKEWDKQIQNLRAEAIEMGVEFIDVDKTSFIEAQKPVRDKLLASSEELQNLFKLVQKIQGE